MSAYTSGPWEFEESGLPGHWIVSQLNRGSIIAACIDNVDNAHLIAAAPTLLEALIALLMDHAPLVEDQDHEVRDEVCDNARAAIAMASRFRVERL